jgi:hypothetical protein
MFGLRISERSAAPTPCGAISGGVDDPNGENEPVKLWLPLANAAFPLPPVCAFPNPNPEDGGGEKNLGGGGLEAKYCEGEVTSLASRREMAPRTAFMSRDRMPDDVCLEKAS